MTDPKYHIAQLNIARMVAPIDSDTMSGFVARTCNEIQSGIRHQTAIETGLAVSDQGHYDGSQTSDLRGVRAWP